MLGEISCYWFPPRLVEEKLLLATTLPHTHSVHHWGCHTPVSSNKSALPEVCRWAALWCSGTGQAAILRAPFYYSRSLGARHSWGQGLSPSRSWLLPPSPDKSPPHTQRAAWSTAWENWPNCSRAERANGPLFSFPPLCQPDCYDQTKGERRDVERGKERAEERRKGGKPKERRLGLFIWGDCDKWLPFCWAVHSHCSVGALGDKRVFERERKTDR